MTALRLSEPIYQTHIYLLVCSAETFQQWLQRQRVKQSEGPGDIGGGFSCTWTDDDGGLCAAIRLNTWRKGDPFDAGQLAHEAQHVTRWVSKRVGLRGAEAPCYYLGWVIREGTRALNGRKKA